MKRFDDAICSVADKTVAGARFDNNSMEYCLAHLWAQQEVELEATRAARAVVNSYARSPKKREELLNKVLNEMDFQGTIKNLSGEPAEHNYLTANGAREALAKLYGQVFFGGGGR